MLPVSVLVPTRNVMASLPDHVKMMQKWLDLVEEVVVVDSSSDDTLEYLEKELAGINARFIPHPAGLYQSWNHGISQMRSRYVYVSTIGDSISRTGLQHLVEVAEKQQCDVVVSPPDLLSRFGHPLENVKWPVHHIISFTEAREPVCFDGFPLFLMAMSFLPMSILGSSASNIYRTKILQENPFPVNFGTMGDTAWAAGHAFSLRYAISPLRTSTFVHHPKTYPLSDYEVEDATTKLFEHALVALGRAADENEEIRTLAQNTDLAKGIRSRIDFDHWRGRLSMSRRGSVPWYVKPAAWGFRCNRENAKKQCLELLDHTAHLNGYRKLANECLGHFFPQRHRS